jgi:phosphatidylinositol alpha-1,6-mannosyltransferase
MAEEAYDPARREPAVAIVGNMHQGLLYKGHQQLIAGWPEVVRACPEAELWIVGGGGGRGEIEARLETLPRAAARRIKFLGRLGDAELNEVYRRCRVFAMPSAGEGFGLVFVEAARHGLPSIGGKYDSAKEIIVHNATGLIVEQHPHDIAFACVRLLRDDALAQRLGEAGRRRYLEGFRFCHFRARLLAALGLAGSPGSKAAANRTG